MNFTRPNAVLLVIAALVAIPFAYICFILSLPLPTARDAEMMNTLVTLTKGKVKQIHGKEIDAKFRLAPLGHTLLIYTMNNSALSREIVNVAQENVILVADKYDEDLSVTVDFYSGFGPEQRGTHLLSVKIRGKSVPAKSEEKRQ